jgi:hypothetical protein
MQDFGLPGCLLCRVDQAEQMVLQGQGTYSALSNCASAMVGAEGLCLYIVLVSERRRC